MRKLLSLLLAFTIMLSLCACRGDFGSVNLNDAVKIPEDGIIGENIIKRIKNENAIGVFEGNADPYKYEWTVFGSDIAQPKELNLEVQLHKTDDGDIMVALKQTEAFGFSALLSVYLGEQWGTQSATAYTGGKAFASVSVTGGKTTILNITLDGSVKEFVISADPLLQDSVLPTTLEETTAPTAETTQQATSAGNYLSKPAENSGQSASGKDKYLTDPIPEGKPKPVEPEDQEIDKAATYTCTFSIDCATILNNLDQLDPEKLEMVPSGGVILPETTVTFYEGESVFDVLQRLCKEKGIHMEASWTPIYNSAYVEGIHNLYEFDCGALSGWMYHVNGWYPNYGSSRYQLKDGDVVQWRYTCDLGYDVGGSYAVGG